MLIDCPSCARSYQVGPDDIGPRGRTVICPRCDESWEIAGDGSPRERSRADDLLTVAVSRRSGYDLPPSARIGARGILRALSPVFGLAACLALMMGAMGARETIVRHATRTAPLYAALGMPVNVRGLDFSDVKTAWDDTPTSSGVIVSGTIRNVAAHNVGMPRLTYEIRDAAGSPLASWTEPAAARTLAVGRTLPFVSSLHDVPAAGRTILVRFEADE